MGEPTTVNTTATDANEAIKVSESAIVTIAETAIIAAYPWMGLPVIKQIWEGVLTWFAGYLAKAAENGATFAIIDIQVSAEESGMSDALTALIAAEKTGDPNAIKLAIQNYANAQSALVHDDGSAPAQ